MRNIYLHLYLFLFNQVTDALTALDKGNPSIARDILICAQQDAEEAYINIDGPRCEIIPFPDVKNNDND